MSRRSNRLASKASKRKLSEMETDQSDETTRVNAAVENFEGMDQSDETTSVVQNGFFSLLGLAYLPDVIVNICSNLDCKVSNTAKAA